MWNISIAEGIYWQSCLDNECKFHGRRQHLPAHVKQSLDDYLLENAIKIDEEFEWALLEIQLDPKNCDTDKKKDESNYDVIDDEFNTALMNLTMVDTKKVEVGIKEARVASKHCKDGKSELSCQKKVEGDSDRCRQDIEESFDSEFAAALMKQLTINPSSCG